jgi:CheY-like chemotaxis protein
MSNNKREVTILITEDDDGHAELITDNLREAGISNDIIRFRDGQEAWDFLSEAGPGPHRIYNHPYLLLLDIRMPRVDGVELLQRLKSHPKLHKMPVIMLTTTDDPREVEACYKLGCNSYVTKPVDFSQFTETLKRLGLFLSVIQVAPIDENS